MSEISETSRQERMVLPKFISLINSSLFTEPTQLLDARWWSTLDKMISAKELVIRLKSRRKLEMLVPVLHAVSSLSPPRSD
ncbi:hypothetical protein L5515_013794 [Caenorhabditis briggsae]|uniref:Uncharacterized protein n=1 Tax=Caenorhabditis briggsae TaxID=6238 RepID=A0AAE9J746_CAEBR|nr:hypothetical protein L5515_013794 [Caenorhabditis briggsae]